MRHSYNFVQTARVVIDVEVRCHGWHEDATRFGANGDPGDPADGEDTRSIRRFLVKTTDENDDERALTLRDGAAQKIRDAVESVLYDLPLDYPTPAEAAADCEDHESEDDRDQT
jgi:hypothetical protein